MQARRSGLVEAHRHPGVADLVVVGSRDRVVVGAVLVEPVARRLLIADEPVDHGLGRAPELRRADGRAALRRGAEREHEHEHHRKSQSRAPRRAAVPEPPALTGCSSRGQRLHGLGLRGGHAAPTGAAMSGARTRRSAAGGSERRPRRARRRSSCRRGRRPPAGNRARWARRESARASRARARAPPSGAGGHPQGRNGVPGRAWTAPPRPAVRRSR